MPPHQPQLLNFRVTAAAAWDDFLSGPTGCLQPLGTHRIEALRNLGQKGTDDGLEQLFYVIGYVLPANVAYKNYSETVHTLGLISQSAHEAAKALLFLKPAVYPLDLSRKKRCAEDRLLANTDRVIWSIIKGWFQWPRSWASLVTAVKGPTIESSLQSMLDKDLATIHSSDECAGAAEQLNHDLYCTQQDYESAVSALRKTSGLVSRFFDDTKPEGDDGLGSQLWGKKHEVMMRGLWTELFTLFGITDRIGYARCITGPREAF